MGDPLSLCRLDVAFVRIDESLKNLRDIVERLQKHDDTAFLMDIDICNLIAFDVEEWLGNKWVPPIPRETIAQKLAADYMRVVQRELRCVDQFLREMWVSNDSRERAVRRERALAHAKRARDTYCSAPRLMSLKWSGLMPRPHSGKRLRSGWPNLAI